PRAPVLPRPPPTATRGPGTPATFSNPATGSYPLPPAAGQCATTAPQTVPVTPLVPPTSPAVPPFCEGTTAPVLPTTSTNGIPGTDRQSAVSETATGTYTFTPAAGQCATTATLTVNVNPLVTPTFPAVPHFCGRTT